MSHGLVADVIMLRIMSIIRRVKADALNPILVLVHFRLASSIRVTAFGLVFLEN